MTQPTYRIRNWNELYENNRTRDMKFMAWVPLPNRHDGDGYTDLVERKNGAALFGAWVAILQVASKCAPRGTLLRNSDASSAPSCDDVRTLLRAGATPHDSASLSRMTRLPKAIIEEMLDVCTNSCKWLEIIEAHEGAEIPHPPAEIPHPTDEERNGTERNRMEGKELSESDPKPLSRVELADEIYGLYPKRVGKPEATKAILKQLKDYPFEVLKEATTKLAALWSGHETTYLAHPATWFNQQRFNDSPETWAPKAATVNGKPQLKPDHANGF